MVSAHARPTPLVPARPSRLGLSAAAIAVAVDVAYVWIIAAQGGPTDGARVAFVALAIAAAAACAGIGSTRPSPLARLPWLGAATGALVGLGVIGLFSIGLPLLVAGFLAGMASLTTSGSAGLGHPRERTLAAVFGLAAPVALVAGIALT
jgi:hypothetical protein